ncbi:MAG: hypothetical protein ACLQJR_31430 [Stellaceae bacterium]
MSYAPTSYAYSYAPASYDGTTLYVPTPAAVAATASGTGGSGATHAWKDGSFSFHDVLDTLNPLQHIPIVSTIYRWVTGDKPGNVARIVGDGIYGGPVGLATGMLSVAVKEETGKDPGEMAVALITGGDAEVTLGSAAAQPAAATATQAATAMQAAIAATTATQASAATTAAAAATPPARAPMTSLFRTPPAATPAAAQGTTSPAEQAFTAQNGALQRSVYGERAAPPAHALAPLQLTGPQLPQRFQRVAPPAAAPAASPGSATPQPGAAAPQPASQAAAQADLSTLPENPPVDIPKRMMEALDKYAHIQQQQRGQQVDVAP